MVQICVDCKKEFDDLAPPHGGSRKQRCAACQKIHTRQLQAAARERNRAARIAKAKAEVAEKKAEQAAAPAPPTAQHVPAPEKKGIPHFRERQEPIPKGINDHLSIEEVVKLAEAEDMSYGKYVALKLNRIRS